MRVTVEIELSEKDWWRLAEIAEAQNLRVSPYLGRELEYVVQSAVSGRRPRTRTRRTPVGTNPYREYPPIADEQKRSIIRDRWASSWSITEIAAQLGVSPQKVGATLWDLNLITPESAAAKAATLPKGTRR